MSDKNPVSKAPPPISPIRGTGSEYHRRPAATEERAKWQVWKFIPKCQVWEAVCLTFDFEPEAKKYDFAVLLRSQNGAPHSIANRSVMPAEFAERLKIVQANVSLNGPIHPQQLYGGVQGDPHAEVLISEIAAFAILCEWPIPDAMRLLTKPQPNKPDFSPSALMTDDMQSAPEMQELNERHEGLDGAGLKKREQQVQAIEKVAELLGYDVQNIPAGGKGKIMALCKYAKPDIFGAGDSSFEGAWKAARKQERVKTKDHEKYVP